MNTSLPMGAAIWPVQTLVQLTITGAPAPPPPGATVIAADLVEAET